MNALAGRWTLPRGEAWLTPEFGQRLLFGILLVMYFPQGDQYLARNLGLMPIPPTIFLLVLAAPLLALVAWREVRHRHQVSPLLVALWRSRWGWAPVALLAVCSLVWSLHPDAFWQGGPRHIFLLSYDLGVLLILLAVSTLPAVRESWRTWLLLAFALLLFTTLWDVLQPGTFSKQMGRAAGLAANANTTAALLVAACAGLIQPHRLRRRDWLLLAAAGLGVLATLSRGGVVLWAVLVGCYLGINLLTLRRRPAYLHARRLVPAAVVICLVFTAAFVLAREGVGMFERPTARARVAMFTGDTSWLSSEEGRLRLLAQAWEQVSDSPILGHGTGASYRTGRGSHNMYLDVWVQWGLVGLGAYLAFLFGSTWYFARRRFLPGLLLMPVIFFWGLLQHGLLDERGLVMLYGLLLGISALERPSEDPGIGFATAASDPSTGSSTASPTDAPTAART